MITKLQEIVAHQSEDISRLSDELYAQQKEIAELYRQIASLKVKLQSAIEDSGVKPIEDEAPPPHY